MNIVNEHIIDAYGCKNDLSDIAEIERSAKKALEGVGASVVKSCQHRFQPHGITLCIILKESHLVVSTWPEHDLAIVNIFLCNATMDPRQCWNEIEKLFRPSRTVIHTVSHQIESEKQAA